MNCLYYTDRTWISQALQYMDKKVRFDSTFITFALSTIKEKNFEQIFFFFSTHHQILLSEFNAQGIHKTNNLIPLVEIKSKIGI
jgi:hypothetical protein